MVKDEVTGRYYHIVMTNEPGGGYMFHFITPEAPVRKLLYKFSIKL